MKEELLKEYAEEALKNGPHRFIRPDDKIFYMDGFKDGYNLGLKAKINMTTISDAPALPEDEDDYKFSIAKEAWDAVNTCTPYHPESFVQGYIAGAEPREKRIEELIALINAERERQEKCDDVHLRKIADLEKENAELKDDNKVMADNYSKMEQKFYNNLTNAKGIIREFVEWATWQGRNCPSFKDIQDKAEQFLKDSEGK